MYRGSQLSLLDLLIKNQILAYPDWPGVSENLTNSCHVSPNAFLFLFGKVLKIINKIIGIGIAELLSTYQSKTAFVLKQALPD